MRGYEYTLILLTVVLFSGIACKREAQSASAPAEVARSDPSPAVETERPKNEASDRSTAAPMDSTSPDESHGEVPVENDDDDDFGELVLGRGVQAFRTGMCFKCHMDHGEGSSRAPNLTDDEWLHCDGSVEGILRVIRSGIPKDKLKDPNRPFQMNPVTNLITDDTLIRDLAVYVHSLSQK